jgi:hypothetical protein
MLTGFLLTLCGFWWKKIFDWLLFRYLHLLGILYVSLLAVMGKYCPLTIWENALREKHESGLAYSGPFIIHYIEKLVYPDINPWFIRIATALIAISTIIIFIIRPPQKRQLNK